MRFTIDQSILLLAAKRAKSIVPDKASDATKLLTYAKIDAGMTGLTVTATDNAITYVGQHSANIEAAGRICLAADDLLRTASALPSGPVSVSLGDREKVTFKSGRNVFTLAGLGTDAYPPLPDSSVGATMTVGAADLRNAIEFALTAAAPDDNKQGFGGVKVEAVGNLVRFLGMDGLRLMWLDIPYTGEVGGGRKSMVPGKALRELLAMLDGIAGPVSVTIADRTLTATTPGAVLTSRMLENELPDYRQIVPTTYERRVIVDRGEWLDGIKRVSAFGTGIARFDFGTGGIAMHASKTDAGRACIEVAADLTGEPVKVGMNVALVRDALDTFGGQKIAVEIGNAMGLIVIRDLDEANAQYVVAPARADGL